MNADRGINGLMGRFRVASRELYNNHFRIDEPYKNNGWDSEERFPAVEAVLFTKMVLEPASLPDSEYGRHNPAILVELSVGKDAPLMVNREVHSGYWDDPVDRVTKDARLLFIKFFDWDQLDYRNNQYVLVQIDLWPSHPETVGKQALIESTHVRFAKASGA